MKSSSIAVETSRSTTQSNSIVRQTNKRSPYLSYTMMNNKHIFNDIFSLSPRIVWEGMLGTLALVLSPSLQPRLSQLHNL